MNNERFELFRVQFRTVAGVPSSSSLRWNGKYVCFRSSSYIQ